MADVLRMAERTGEAIDDIGRCTSEGIIDMIGVMMSACEGSGVEDVRSRVGAGELTRL